MQQQSDEEAQTKHQLAAIENLAKTLLDKDALSRFGNIKAANPELATQVTLVIAQLAHAGKIRKQLTDSEFRALLDQITPKKRDIKITRK